MGGSELIVIELVVRLIGGVIAAAIASSKGRSAVGWFFGGFFLFILGIIIVACLGNLKEKRRREEAIDRENRRLREQLMQEQMKGEAFRRHASARLDQHDVQIGVDTRNAVPALTMGTPQFASGYPMLGNDAIQLPSAQPAEAWPGVPQAAPFPAAFAPQPTTPVPGTAPGMVHVNNGMVRMNNGAMPQQPPMPSNGAAPPPPLPPSQQAAHNVTPTREWHYEVRGETRGPITDRQLVAMAQSGEVTTATLLWTEQLGEWKPAGQVKPLQPHLRS